MIVITIDESNQQLEFTAKGDNFSSIIEDFKFLNLTYNPKKKVWNGDVGLINKYIDELTEHGISIDEYTKKYIKNYFDNISDFEQIKTRSNFRLFKPELLKTAPL